VLGLLFPASVDLLPLFLRLRNLNLRDTPWALALPKAAFARPVTIVSLRPSDTARIRAFTTLSLVPAERRMLDGLTGAAKR
jgi:ABC-type glycerol-3-phosphate transport system permease component